MYTHSCTVYRRVFIIRLSIGKPMKPKIILRKRLVYLSLRLHIFSCKYFMLYIYTCTCIYLYVHVCINFYYINNY